MKMNVNTLANNPGTFPEKAYDGFNDQPDMDIWQSPKYLTLNQDDRTWNLLDIVAILFR